MIEPRQRRFLIVAFLAAAIGFFVLGFLVSKGLVHQAADPIFARLGETVVGAKDVMPKVEDRVIEHEKAIYRLKREATEDLIFQKTKAASEPVESLKVDNDVTETEVQAWAKARGIQLGKLTTKQHEDLVANYLVQRRQLRAGVDRQKSLRSAGIVWTLPVDYRRDFAKTEPGRLSVSRVEPALNQVTLFANFHCGHCAGLAAKMRELSGAAGQGLAISLRFNIQPGDAPLVSRTARAAYCAADQNKFSEFFEFASLRPPMDTAALKSVIEELRVDAKKFESCIDDPKTESRLAKDIAESSRISPTGRPVAVVNDRVLPLEEPIDEYLFLLGK